MVTRISQIYHAIAFRFSGEGVEDEGEASNEQVQQARRRSTINLNEPHYPYYSVCRMLF